MLQNTKKISPKEIGIITPYKAQADCITKELDKAGGTKEGDKFFNLDVSIMPVVFLCCAFFYYCVDTVDGFQGREKKVIIFSAVRSRGEVPLFDCYWCNLTPF